MVGLVFGGGGAKGAYQIGVWKFLREKGLDKSISAVSGVSIGGLNATLFVQGNYELAEYIWRNISKEYVLQLNKSKMEAVVNVALTTICTPQRLPKLIKNIKPEMLCRIGIFTRTALLEIIDNYLDLNYISKSKILTYAACCKIPSFKAKYFMLNNMVPEKIESVLLATSAIPGIFDIEKIQGNFYIDGGIVDNLPIKPLYDIGYRKFIVVNLDPLKKVNYSEFKNCEIWEISPNNHLEYFESNDLMDFGTSSYSPSALRIKFGYEDAAGSFWRRVINF